MTPYTFVFNRSYFLCILDFVVISHVCQYVCVCACVRVSVCMFPRREVISQPIFKYDTSTDAYSEPEGVSENRFKIKPEVEKLFRKILIKCSFFNQFSSFGHCSGLISNVESSVFSFSTKAGGNTSSI